MAIEETIIMQLLAQVLSTTLRALYQSFWAALLLTALASFFYLYCTGPVGAGKGYGAALRAWARLVRESPFFRKLLLLVFYTATILCQTLLFRRLQTNPLEYAAGSWAVCSTSPDGVVTPDMECIGNVMMLMPFTFLLLWLLGERLAPTGRLAEVAWASVRVSFLFSLSIEMLQLVLCLGFWQLSDLAFNTLGGLLGGVAYWAACRVRSYGGADGC